MSKGMTIELRFKLGDEVWFICDNKVIQGKVTFLMINANINDSTSVRWHVSYNHKDLGYDMLAENIPDARLFETKEALVNSLLANTE